MRFLAAVRAAFVVLLIHIAQAPILQAGIIPISQTRTIHASGQVEVCVPPNDPENCTLTTVSFGESKTAPDFGLFDESLSFFGVARAGQRSFISPTLVSAVGEALGPGSFDPPNHDIFSQSLFGLTFDIEKTETWRLIASAGYGGLGAYSLRLSGPSGDIINIFSFPFESVVDQLIELTPGRYSLSASAESHSFSNETGGGRYDLTFQTTIPEPGSAGLLGLGAAVLGFLRLRKGRR